MIMLVYCIENIDNADFIWEFDGVCSANMGHRQIRARVAYEILTETLANGKQKLFDKIRTNVCSQIDWVCFDADLKQKRKFLLKTSFFPLDVFSYHI
jgi:hypothetical protein